MRSKFSSVFKSGVATGTILAAMALAPAGAAALPGDERFTSVCTPSHTAPDDPIVFPKVPGASHMHQFFGNPATNARSTSRKLRRRPNTTCNLAGDFSGYWVPTLMIDGAAVAPKELRVYYSAKGRDPSTIEEIPKNLMMVAGDAHPTGSQAPWIATWGCTSTALFFVNNYVPTPSCAIGSALVLAIFFPDCWDGTNLDSADHKSHMAYAVSKPFSRPSCPASHPVPIPAISYILIYPTTGATSGIELSSAGTRSGHADFMNGWRPAALRAKMAECIHTGPACPDS